MIFCYRILNQFRTFYPLFFRFVDTSATASVNCRNICRQVCQFGFFNNCPYCLSFQYSSSVHQKICHSGTFTHILHSTLFIIAIPLQVASISPVSNRFIHPILASFKNSLMFFLSFCRHKLRLEITVIPFIGKIFANASKSE